ncbi:MAG: glycosyltransferase family 4 protein [Verrucomicrobiota bacterium]
MNSPLNHLRVALIATSLRRGGGEKQVVSIARALLGAGVDLQIFYLGSGGHYEPALREMKVPVHSIYFPNGSWKMLLTLIADLRRWRPQVVLAGQFGDLQFAGIAGRLCRALTLGCVQSDGWFELRTYGRLSRLLVLLAHGLVTSSHHAREVLASQRVNLRKMEVLPNLIDLRDFDARSALAFNGSLPADRVIAAAVGSLQPCKRFDRFLEALALARRDEPALAGVIAGADYGERAGLEARAKALGLMPPDLIFLGECDRVPALLARSAMLVLTSDYEGLPNVVLEAMAARLPVVTTPAGDAGVVVQHGRTGFVAPPDDARGMAAHMVRLAQSPALRREFGEAGRKRVEQEYNVQALADRLVGIFHDFAARQRRGDLLELLESDVGVRKAEKPCGATLAERLTT